MLTPLRPISVQDSTMRAASPSDIPFFSICSQIAPIANMAVFLAPLPTMYQIQREKSVGNLPLLPYTSMLNSAWLWTLYGVRKKQPSLYYSQAFGFLFAVFYIFFFIRYAPPQSPTLPGSVKRHLQISVVLQLTGIYWFVTKSDETLGHAAVLLCLLLFGSPLAALRTVAQTGSSHSIPLPFCFASVVSNACWTVTGYTKMHDPDIYVTCGLGLCFGLLQLAVKTVYPEKGEAALALLPPKYHHRFPWNKTVLSPTSKRAAQMYSPPTRGFDVV